MKKYDLTTPADYKHFFLTNVSSISNPSYITGIVNLLDYLNSKGYLCSKPARFNKNFCIYLPNKDFVCKCVIFDKGNFSLTGSIGLILGTKNGRRQYLQSTLWNKFSSNFGLPSIFPTNYSYYNKNFSFSNPIATCVPILISNIL